MTLKQAIETVNKNLNASPSMRWACIVQLSKYKFAIASTWMCVKYQLEYNPENIVNVYGRLPGDTITTYAVELRRTKKPRKWNLFEIGKINYSRSRK